MAKESESDDSAPDSRPISVAELLARQRSEDQGAGGQQTAAGREGRGRRRVGRDGSRSVSELTGEIPRISGDPAHPLPSQPTSQQSPEPSPGTGAYGGRPGRGSAFPRSSEPTVRRAEDGRPVADPSPWPRPASAGQPTASGMPGFAGPAGTRDFNAGDVADRAGRPAADVPGSQGRPADPARTEAVTGIIPVVDDRDSQSGPGRDVVDRDDLVGVDLDAPPAGSQPSTRSSGFAEVMDDHDFEEYRSFSDVEKPTRPKPARTGLLGKLKRKAKGGAGKAAGAAVVTGEVAAAAAEAIVHRAHHDAPSHGGDTRTHPNSDTPAGHVPDGAFHPGVSGADTVTNTGPTGSGQQGARPPTPTPEEPTAGNQGSGLTDDTDQRGLGDLVSGSAAGTTGSSGGSTSTFGPATGAAAAGAGAAGPVGRRSRADGDADKPAPSGTASWAADTGFTNTRAADTGFTEARAADAAEGRRGRSDKRAHTPSPLVAWLSVIGQAIVGLAIGVGLFWGFVELWKWNVYFALVLAVVVIFGIVAITHLIRRNRDLPTTLLALAVGLIVTIGPLVVLLAV